MCAVDQKAGLLRAREFKGDIPIIGAEEIRRADTLKGLSVTDHTGTTIDSYSPSFTAQEMKTSVDWEKLKLASGLQSMDIDFDLRAAGQDAGEIAKFFFIKAIDTWSRRPENRGKPINIGALEEAGLYVNNAMASLVDSQRINKAPAGFAVILQNKTGNPLIMTAGEQHVYSRDQNGNVTLLSVDVGAAKREMDEGICPVDIDSLNHAEVPAFQLHTRRNMEQFRRSSYVVEAPGLTSQDALIICNKGTWLDAARSLSNQSKTYLRDEFKTKRGLESAQPGPQGNSIKPRSPRETSGRIIEYVLREKGVPLNASASQLGEALARIVPGSIQRNPNETPGERTVVVIANQSRIKHAYSPIEYRPVEVPFQPDLDQLTQMAGTDLTKFKFDPFTQAPITPQNRDHVLQRTAIQRSALAVDIKPTSKVSPVTGEPIPPTLFEDPARLTPAQQRANIEFLQSNILQFRFKALAAGIPVGDVKTSYSLQEIRRIKDAMVAKKQNLARVEQVRPDPYAPIVDQARREQRWVYATTQFPAVPQGHIRLYRGVQPRAISTEHAGPPSPQEEALFHRLTDQIINNGPLAANDAEAYKILQGRILNWESKFFTPDQNLALHTHARGGVVYYMDVPQDEAAKWQKVGLRANEVVNYEVPYARANTAARPYAIGPSVPSGVKI